YINILWFGVTKEKPDITENLSKATWLAYKLNTSVYIPRNSYSYKIKKSSKIYSSVNSNNAIIIAQSDNTRFFNLQKNNISITGINFQVLNSKKLVSAPIAIEINGFNNI